MGFLQFRFWKNKNTFNSHKSRFYSRNRMGRWHHHHRRMRLLFLALIFSSCSPQPAEQNALPRYSDMGAAADAGNLTHETNQ